MWKAIGEWSLAIFRTGFGYGAALGASGATSLLSELQIGRMGSDSVGSGALASWVVGSTNTVNMNHRRVCRHALHPGYKEEHGHENNVSEKRRRQILLW